MGTRTTRADRMLTLMAGRKSWAVPDLKNISSGEDVKYCVTAATMDVARYAVDVPSMSRMRNAMQSLALCLKPRRLGRLFSGCMRPDQAKCGVHAE